MTVHASIRSLLAVTSFATLSLACSAAPNADSAEIAESLSATTAVSPSAATKTAQTDPLCTQIAPFYWEIGDKSSTAASIDAGGAIPKNGVATYNQTSSLEIASASKFVFGAYVVERERLLLDLPGNATQPTTASLATAFQALTMRSGYISFDSDLCAAAEGLNSGATIADCFHVGNNDAQTGVVGSFDYNGGNFQAFAVNQLLIGSLDTTALVNEYNRVLGSDLTFGFKFPDLAGGMQTSARDYAAFLRKILSGGLAISKYLGYAPVCTLPASETSNRSLACKNATYSPAVGLPWDYSWGHWIESDGAFSSPGKLGFYPWIDKTQKYYGIVAREDSSAGAYLQSAQCGEDIRSAFFSGKVYSNGAATK